MSLAFSWSIEPETFTEHKEVRYKRIFFSSQNIPRLSTFLSWIKKKKSANVQSRRVHLENEWDKRIHAMKFEKGHPSNNNLEWILKIWQWQKAIFFLMHYCLSVALRSLLCVFCFIFLVIYSFHPFNSYGTMCSQTDVIRTTILLFYCSNVVIILPFVLFNKMNALNWKKFAFQM